MKLLDTDHVSVLRYFGDPRVLRLKDRLSASAISEDIATTVITAEEQLRGWLSRLHAERNPRRQTIWYGKLADLLNFFQAWRVELFDDLAASKFLRLRDQRVRIGTQDLKVASIAMTRGALLLSRNLRDFSRVQGLRVEDWLN